MADRTLVTYEEERNEDGPYWTLTIERSAAGAPGGIVSIEFRSIDGTLEPERRTIVMDDLRRLLPATDWAAGVDERQRQIQQLGKTRIGSSINREMDQAILFMRDVLGKVQMHAAIRVSGQTYVPVERVEYLQRLLQRVANMGRSSEMVHGSALQAYIQGGLDAAEAGADGRTP